MGHDYRACTDCNEVFYCDGNYCDVCEDTVCPRCRLITCAICSCDHDLEYSGETYADFDDPEVKSPNEAQLALFQPNSPCSYFRCACVNHTCVRLSVCKGCRKGHQPTDEEVKQELVRLSGLSTDQLAAKLGVDSKVAVDRCTIPPRFRRFKRRCKVCSTVLGQDELHVNYKVCQGLGVDAVPGELSCNACAVKAGVTQGAPALIPDIVNLVVEYDQAQAKRKRPSGASHRERKRRKVV